ncbi:MAG: hypothetical protein HZA36_02415 [Parcubacteria group bacterium]|nr:hypothetical protein [Parcubacteria group bacterium]
MNHKIIFFIIALILGSNLVLYGVLHREIRELRVPISSEKSPKNSVTTLVVKLRELKGNDLLVTVQKSNTGYSPVSYSDAVVRVTDMTKIGMLELPKVTDTKDNALKPIKPEVRELSFAEFGKFVISGMELNIGSTDDISEKTTFDAASIFFVNTK